MNPSTFPARPDDVLETLDIDLDVLDHALMDLLTSDWQTLDDGEPSDAAVTARQFSPTL